MKKIDLSSIATGIAMYTKAGTYQFLQLAYQEIFTELVTSRIGASYDPTKGYILNGCINSGSGSNYIISAGSIFFNGEIYLVPAVTFTISGSNVAEGLIDISQYVINADPTDFTDGIQRNVHNIRQIKFQAGLAGSGAVNFLTLINLAYRPVGAIGQTIMWTMPGIGTQNALLATFFDPSTGVGIHGLSFGWKIDITLSGFVPAGYKESDSIYGTIGDDKGSDTYKIVANDLPALVSEDDFQNTGGSGVNGFTSAPAGTDRPITVNGGSPNNPISLMQSTVIKLYITRYY